MKDDFITGGKGSAFINVFIFCYLYRMWRWKYLLKAV